MDKKTISSSISFKRHSRTGNLNPLVIRCLFKENFQVITAVLDRDKLLQESYFDIAIVFHLFQKSQIKKQISFVVIVYLFLDYQIICHEHP